MSRKTEALTSQTIGAFLNGLHRGDCSSAARLHGVELTTDLLPQTGQSRPRDSGCCDLLPQTGQSRPRDSGCW
jgi:hypothetical protein